MLPSTRPGGREFSGSGAAPCAGPQGLEPLCHIHNELTQAWANVDLPPPQSSHLHLMCVLSLPEVVEGKVGLERDSRSVTSGGMVVSVLHFPQPQRCVPQACREIWSCYHLPIPAGAVPRRRGTGPSQEQTRVRLRGRLTPVPSWPLGSGSSCASAGIS